jgi:adenosylcobinamide hydrolase
MRHRHNSELMTRFRVEQHTLLIDLGARRRVLSSAPRGGGLVRARFILNHQVPANPIMAQVRTAKSIWYDPAQYLGRLARRIGVDHRCVALMTAVSLTQLVTLREEQDGLWVEGFFTVGVSNAVRAGEPVVSPDGGRVRLGAGTINIILVTNARLSSSAMVGAVQVATESKTAVLLAKGVPSWTKRPGATGTGTDAVVIACGNGPTLRYSGTHTLIGAMFGRLVSRGVQEGLLRSGRWNHLAAGKKPV